MSEAATVQDNWEFYTDLAVGEILRRTREHCGKTLEDVESILRIRASQLEALETGDLEKLPGRVYAIGFVRSYAEYLGLDGDKMVHLFKVQSVGGQSKPELHFPVPASESKIPNFLVLGASVAGLVLVLLIWSIFSISGRDRDTEIPPVPAELKAEINEISGVPFGPENEAVSAALDLTEPGPSLQTGKITLKITESSWVEIRNAEGKAVLSSVLGPGDAYDVPEEEGLTLTTGNAGGIIIEIDGKALPSLGGKGDVRRNILLDAMSLSGKNN